MDTNLNRRSFMVRTIYAIFGFIGAVMAVALGGFGVVPALKKRQAGWSEAGTTDDLAVDQPSERRFFETVKSGWQSEKVERSVWLVKRPNGSVEVFSASCPHLGCGYRWIAEHKRFECPCHGSIFDINGKVLAGPAPRRLDTLPTKMENGKLFVQYEVFQLGTSKKIVV
jgi:menaquinol-cytochrome c reductase iron-sulfur subunit